MFGSLARGDKCLMAYVRAIWKDEGTSSRPPC